MEPGEGRFVEEVGPQQDIMPWIPSSKTAIFSMGTDLCLIEISWNSGRPPGPTWIFPNSCGNMGVVSLVTAIHVQHLQKWTN